MQEILYKAAISQQNFKQEMNYIGYETKTTFYGDFTIAELVSGVEGVKDTFKRAFEEWKTNVDTSQNSLWFSTTKRGNTTRKTTESYLCSMLSCTRKQMTIFFQVKLSRTNKCPTHLVY